MSKPKWKSGPPPHIGWWNASISKDRRVWRWWDGKKWSRAVHEGKDAVSAGRCARQPRPVLTGASRIYWTDYYPENARVPRVNPNIVTTAVKAIN